MGPDSIYMSSYQCEEFHGEDNALLPSGILRTSKMTSLYWNCPWLFNYVMITEGGMGLYWIHPDVCPTICPSVCR